MQLVKNITSLNSSVVAERISNVSSQQATGLPNVFVVGAAKSGTTALYHYFKAHPQIFVPPSIKETNYMAFYNGLPPLRGPRDQKIIGKSITSLSTYRALYRGCTNELGAADVSPAYLYYDCAPYRIAELCPQAKIVMVLRNPVEAAFSMYAMMRRDGREPCRSFWEAFERSAERQLAGWEWAWDYESYFRYVKPVTQYLKLFPKSQLFIRPYEVLKNDPAGFYFELTEFLGASLIDLSGANRQVNTSPSRGDMLSKSKAGRLLMRAARRFSFPLPKSIKGCLRFKMDQPAFVLTSEDRRRLIDHFGPDIYNLSLLLSWDVSEWLKLDTD